MRLIEISLLKNIPLLPWIIEREGGGKGRGEWGCKFN
jgi:hypothetical protein